MKKQKEKQEAIKRLKTDPKSTKGVDSVKGFKSTPFDKEVFKKDLPETKVGGK